MPQFKVVHGTHVHILKDGSRRAFSKGEVLSSDANLCERFPGKFERVVHYPAEPIAVVDSVVKPAPPPVVAEPVKSPPVAAPVVTTPAKRSAGRPKKQVFYGEDVSNKFRAAKKHGYKVTQNEDGFWVFEAGGKSPLNSKSLTRVDVGDFIEDQV